MQLFVKVIPLRAGTGEPAGEPRLLCCPPDVEPDTVLSFLIQRLGEVIETVWTSTEHHIRMDIGWVFGGARATGPQEAVEFACVPLIEGRGGSLVPMFEVQAGQRRQFAQLADSHGVDTTVIQQPHRAYHPAAGQAVQDISTSEARQAGSLDELDQALAAIARLAGATRAATPGPATPPAASSCETTATTAAATTKTPPSNKTAHYGSPATTKALASASSSAAASPPTNGSTWSPPAGSRPWSGSSAATITVTMCSRFWPHATSARAGRSATS